MARPKQHAPLLVRMNGDLVGRWESTHGRSRFEYASEWLAAEDSCPLSLSIPLLPGPIRGGAVDAWFDNLLPDGRELRDRIRVRFAARSDRPIDLLREVGRDCVGAVQICPADEDPADVRTIAGHPMSEADVAACLRENRAPGTGTAGTAHRTPFRISLAGAQLKLAFLWHAGRWHEPLGATPTTHIFKQPIGRLGHFGLDLSHSIENEWLCARILRAFGQPVANCEIASFEDQGVLIVNRFDRRLASDGSWWIRLPQEDMCQATGIRPADKYEAEGGPGIGKIMDLLLGSEDAVEDRRAFFRAQILFWALGAIDGHAKNFSIALLVKGRFRLTPLNDVLSAYPLVGASPGRLPIQQLEQAMAVWGRNRHYRWDQIRPRHWRTTAADCGVGAFVEPILQEIRERTPGVLDEVRSDLPTDFPAEVAEPILDGLRGAVERLA